MKIRKGFVSNSSSSSFIIAFKEEPCCPTCGRKKFNVAEHFRTVGEGSCWSDCTRLRAEGHDSIMHCLTEWYDEPYNARDKELSAKIKELESDGYIVQYVDINYHDKYIKETVESDSKVLEYWD